MYKYIIQCGILYCSDGRQCIDTQVYDNKVFDHIDRRDQAADIYTEEYLCNVAMGTDPCPANYYSNYGMSICEELYCVDPNDANDCIGANFIPPHGW